MMITCKSDLVKEQYQNHLGVNPDKQRDINLVVRTSGTTGNPLSISMNNIDFENITDIGAKCFINAGVKPGMRIIHCLNFQMWAGGIIDFTSLMKTKAAAFPYGVGNAKELINTIMYYDIEGISCTPSYMRRIKEVLKEEFNMSPKTLGLKYGFFGGESGIQNPNFRKNIEEEWGIEALNANYGSADTISILASENYTMKDGLKFMAGDIASASIKIGDHIVAPRKGLIGELLITTTYEGGLIKRENYSTGDIVEILSDDKEFRFDVLGRSDEMIVLKGLNLYPSSIRDIVSEIGLSQGLTNLNSQLLVSREDPIEEALLFIDDGDSFHISYDIPNMIEKEIHDRLSLTIPVEYGIIAMSANGKTKQVERTL